MTIETKDLPFEPPDFRPRWRQAEPHSETRDAMRARIKYDVGQAVFCPRVSCQKILDVSRASRICCVRRDTGELVSVIVVCDTCADNADTREHILRACVARECDVVRYKGKTFGFRSAPPKPAPRKKESQEQKRARRAAILEAIYNHGGKPGGIGSGAKSTAEARKAWRRASGVAVISLQVLRAMIKGGLLTGTVGGAHGRLRLTDHGLEFLRKERS